MASRDDAFVAHDSSSDLWTIGSTGLELAVGFGADHVLGFQSLSDPVSGKTLNITPGSDQSFTANGTAVQLSNSNPMKLVSAVPSADDRGVRLVFTFEHTQLNIRVIGLPSRMPTIETWTDRAARRTRVDLEFHGVADHDAGQDRELARRPARRYCGQ